MAAPATLSWVGGEPENLAYVLSIDNAGACISCRFASTCWTVKVFLPLMSAMDTTLLLTSTGDAKAELMSDAARAKCELKCILWVWYGHERDDGALCSWTRSCLPGDSLRRPDGRMLYNTQAIQMFYGFCVGSAWLTNGHDSTAVANRS